jgi:DNA-binding transcriptional MerR regulator
MNTYNISQIAHSFNLSRSTLIYYDRIGLLKPHCRTESGYRCYNENDFMNLEKICNFREAGLTIKNIKEILCSDNQPQANIFEKRLHEINREILLLKEKQRLLSKMFESVTTVNHNTKLNKEMWIDMLREVGMDEDAMDHWHAEFERRAPDEHNDFLLSLGISEEEAAQIRNWAANFKVNMSP